MDTLNKFIEDIALKEVEEAIVLLEMLDEQLIKTSQTAKANSKSLALPTVSNADMNKKLMESQKLIKQLEKDLLNQEKALQKLSEKLDKNTAARQKNTQAITNNSINQSLLLKNVKEEEIMQSNLTTYISKLSVERLREARIVQDGIAKKQMNIALSEEENQELARAVVAHGKLDAAIKAGKGATGDAREYVGQYERANRGLSNSINQIARELPAATFGFQTFALGISNNVPIAVDEIKKAIAANKELIAQGKPTVSVWKQVTSALFSFNSVMSIGLLLLALYGKEIGDFFSKLVNGEKSLNDTTRALQEFQVAQSKGIANTKNEINTYEEYLKIAGDKTLGIEKQTVAIEKLRKTYPAWLQALSNEQIIKLKGSKIDKEIRAALESGEQYKTTLNEIQDINSRIEAYKLEIKTRIEYQQYIKEQKKTQEAGTRSTGREGSVETMTNEAKAAKKNVELAIEREKIRKESTKNEEINGATTAQLMESLTGLQELYNASLGKSQVLKEKSILLEDVADKKAKDKKERFKADKDYYASAYELERRRVELIKDSSKEVAENDELNYQLRQDADQVYSDSLRKLAELDRTEQKRVLEKVTADEKEQLGVRYRNGEISLQEYNNNLIANAQDRSNKLELIEVNYLNNLVIANKETVQIIKGVWDDLSKQKANNAISVEELEDVKRLGTLLQEIDFGNLAPTEENINKVKAKLKEIDDLKVYYNRKAEADRMEVDIQDTQHQLDLLADTEDNVKRRLELEGDLTQKKIALIKLQNEAIDTNIAKDEERTEKAKDANEKILESWIELGHNIGELANQLFQNTIDNYDRQIAKSNEYYDGLIENAEKGSAQEKALQEEKEKREDQLQQRKIAAQRRQAIFNKLLSVIEIGINLAKQISAINAYAALLGPLGNAYKAVQIPLAIGSAAVQTATVLATPLPQYEKGREDGPAETALINEKRIEPVESKDGRIRIYQGKNRVVNLKKGDKVYPSIADLNKSKMNMQQAAIMASFASQQNQLGAFDFYLGREFRGISGKIENGIEKGFKKAKINNTINIPRGDYDHDRYRRRGFRA